MPYPVLTLVFILRAVWVCPQRLPTAHAQPAWRDAMFMEAEPMPYISITTTQILQTAQKQALRQAALNAAALLGKNRAHVMVCILDGAFLTKGDGDQPCAFCDVRVMGYASPGACQEFARALSEDVAQIANTAPGCVYLSISEMTQCYTDGCLPPGH